MSDAYMESRKKTLRPATRAHYEKSVKYLKDWHNKPLREITADMVEKRHQDLQQQVAEGGRYSGHATANQALLTLSAIWNFAARRDDTLGTNPVRRRLQGQWFPVERRNGHVNNKNLPKFYRAITELPNPVARDYLLLLLFTGMRRGEAATLTWHDVDFDDKIIRVPAERTKGNRELVLPMTDVVHSLLMQRRSLGDADWVFPANSSAGHIAQPRAQLDAIGAATGIQASPHDLRRTYITVAEAIDIEWSALMQLVNHKLPGVTGRYMVAKAEDRAERLRAPAQKVADRLKQLCGIVEPAGATVMRLS
jgi:integrase